MSRAPPDPLHALLALLCLAASLGAPTRAAEPAADEDLLEFLGGIGGEDADFTEYLSKTDIAQAAKTAPKPAPAPPPAPASNEVKKS